LARQKYVRSGAEYQLSRIEYGQQWQTLDDCLYRLCRENQTHSCLLGVNAKVFIIGLTFETGIKRQVRTKRTQGSSISQVVKLLHGHHQELDGLFLRLSGISEPLTPSNLTEILEIHGLIVKMLRSVTRDQHDVRSFVSKYMHFHNPAVPLYDTNADTVLTSLVPWPSVRKKEVTVREADSYYAKYANRFLSLYDSMRSEGLVVTVRALDYYLLWKFEKGKP
jgi:hypothetical protein